MPQLDTKNITTPRKILNHTNDLINTKTGSEVKFRNNRAGREGSWDYKQLGKKYADGGNANYGAVGSALGIPEQVLLREAGWAQERAGSNVPENGHWTGDPPYGDDPEDQKNTIKGVDYFRNR